MDGLQEKSGLKNIRENKWKRIRMLLYKGDKLTIMLVCHLYFSLKELHYYELFGTIFLECIKYSFVKYFMKYIGEYKINFTIKSEIRE